MTPATDWPPDAIDRLLLSVRHKGRPWERASDLVDRTATWVSARLWDREARWIARHVERGTTPHPRWRR